MKEPAIHDLSIGALSEQAGVSVRAIRHYDENGFLDSVRGPNGYRIFSKAAVGQVRQIQRLINSGFSLVEIKEFPECMRLTEGTTICEITTEAHRARLAKVEKQLVELEQRRKRLISALEDGKSDIA